MAAKLTSSKLLSRLWRLEVVVARLMRELPEDAESLEVIVYLDGMQNQRSSVVIKDNVLPVRFDITSENNPSGAVRLMYSQGVYEKLFKVDQNQEALNSSIHG